MRSITASLGEIERLADAMTGTPVMDTAVNYVVTHGDNGGLAYNRQAPLGQSTDVKVFSALNNGQADDGRTCEVTLRTFSDEGAYRKTVVFGKDSELLGLIISSVPGEVEPCQVEGFSRTASALLLDSIVENLYQIAPELKPEPEHWEVTA